MNATTPTIEITAGQKYTLVIENGMGFTVVRHVRLHSAEFTNYAQYRNVPKLVLTYKGKRKKKGLIFTDNSVAIAPGWQDIKGQDLSDATCFDGQSFEEVTAKLEGTIFTKR